MVTQEVINRCAAVLNQKFEQRDAQNPNPYGPGSQPLTVLQEIVPQGLTSDDCLKICRAAKAFNLNIAYWASEKQFIRTQE